MAEEKINEILDRFLGEYEAQRDRLSTVQQRLVKVSATAHSDRRQVSVTVGAQGQLTGLKFNSRDYERLAPGDLAKLILDTARQAQEKVQAEMVRDMEATLPAGMSMPDGMGMADLLAGRVDVADLLPREPINRGVLEQLMRARPSRSGHTALPAARAGSSTTPDGA